MKDDGPKGMGTSRETPHVSFPPLKPEFPKISKIEHRHEKGMPTYGDSGLMGSYGPNKLDGSFGSKNFIPMEGFFYGKPLVEYPRRT